MRTTDLELESQCVACIALFYFYQVEPETPVM